MLRKSVMVQLNSPLSYIVSRDQHEEPGLLPCFGIPKFPHIEAGDHVGESRSLSETNPSRIFFIQQS